MLNAKEKTFTCTFYQKLCFAGQGNFCLTLSAWNNEIQQHYFIPDITLITFVDINLKNSTAFLHSYCAALTKHSLKSAFFILFEYICKFFLPNSIVFNAFSEDKWVSIFICSVSFILHKVIWSFCWTSWDLSETCETYYCCTCTGGNSCPPAHPVELMLKEWLFSVMPSAPCFSSSFQSW